MTLSPASRFAGQLLRALVRGGVRDVVLCPGSRSQALAVEALHLAAEGALRVHVRIDERVAGFTALGIGLETGHPAVVITTSGSAVAQLYPAVLEAHHSGVGMILLTADRPAELRGIGSNQTTTQTDFFGEFVRASLDIDAPTDEWPEHSTVDEMAREALARASGPVHLNLAFREPLSGGRWMPDSAIDEDNASPVPSPDASSAEGLLTVSRGLRTLVIAGTGAGPTAEELAHQGGWPLIAEVSSGSRFGRNLVPAYREVLRTATAASRVERIIVFGHPTLSREVPALIEKAPDGCEVIVVDSGASEMYNPAHRATAFVSEVVVEPGEVSPADRDWLGEWMRAGHAAHAAWVDRYVAANPSQAAPDVEQARSADVNDMREFARTELAAARSKVTRESLVDAVWRASWPHDRLVFGASRMIRVADRTLPGKKIPVFANRGLAGIDGTIATASGIALASGALTRVLLGDLAALHDAGAMLIGPLEQRPRIQVIVANDGGGTIFDSLELADSLEPDIVDRGFYTPHEANFAQLAAAYGWSYIRVETSAELERALTTPSEDAQLIEVVLER